MADTNPWVWITTSIPDPPKPNVTRVLYSRFSFADFYASAYGISEFDNPTFEPSENGNYSLMGLSLADTKYKYNWANKSMPAFLSEDKWDQGFNKNSSVFLTPRNSLMPKLLVPDTMMVDNGWLPVSGSSQSRFFAKTALQDGTDRWLFNWRINTFNGNAPSASEVAVMQSIHGSEELKMIQMKPIMSFDTDVTYQLELPSIPTSRLPTGFWRSGTDGQLVGNGAMTLLVFVTPLNQKEVAASDIVAKRWAVVIDIGDEIELQLLDGDSLAVTISSQSASTTEQPSKVQLAMSRAVGNLPQVNDLQDGKIPYVITIYPVWNGIVVQSGVQDTKGNLTNVMSQFVPKQKGASVMDPEYITPDEFDYTDPPSAPWWFVQAPSKVIVDFGDSVIVEGTNCALELAYIPCFFWFRSIWDTWLLRNKNDSNTTYSFHAYPIWTNNGHTPISFGFYITNSFSPDREGIVANTEFMRIRWYMGPKDYDTSTSLKPSRYAWEIFGFLLRVEEERTYVVDTDNGSFALNWTPAGQANAGDYANPSSYWPDYITNVTVNIGLDGTSGGITVDKYGLVGQNAEAIQRVGAIAVGFTGGTGTLGGTIYGNESTRRLPYQSTNVGGVFRGIGMGIGESKSSDGTTWTIPLVGLEKKMQEIVLIDAPFFDGWLVRDAIDFLCRYGGINYSFQYAPVGASRSTKLPSSQNIDVSIFDFKTGTPVIEALNSIVEQGTNMDFVIRDGYVFFYDLDNTTSYPTMLGPNWKGYYPDVKVFSDDQMPDFQDLRNEIVVVGFEAVSMGNDTDIRIPSSPRFSIKSNTTKPKIPWSRQILEPISGTVTDSIINARVNQIKTDSKRYELSGSVTIPGNARIRPYDQWGNKIIVGVSHSLDTSTKVWTTSLELARGPE